MSDGVRRLAEMINDLQRRIDRLSAVVARITAPETPPSGNVWGDGEAGRAAVWVGFNTLNYASGYGLLRQTQNGVTAGGLQSSDLSGITLDDIGAGGVNLHLTTTLKSNYDSAYTHSLSPHPFGLVGTKDVDESQIGDGKYLRYNAQSGKYELAAVAAPVWGSIAGTLSDQADLQSALDARLKLDQREPQTITGGVPLLDEDRVINNLHQIVDKRYVDEAVTALAARYYMTDNNDSTGYKLTSRTQPGGNENALTVSGVVDGQYIGGWISPVGETPAKLISGIYNWNIELEKTSGTKTLRLYWIMYERKSDGTEVMIAQSMNSDIVTSRASHVIPVSLSSDYAVASGSRIVGKIYARVSGNGDNPTVNIYYAGNTSSRWEIPTNTEVLSGIYVPYSGAAANVNLGSYSLTANTITVNSLSSGQVVFSGTSGSLSGASDLYWDNTNKRLGVGASSPTATLYVMPKSTSDVVFATRVLQSEPPLGPELITNGDFASDTGWTWGTGWTWDSTNKEADHAAGNTAPLTQNISVTSGNTYVLQFTIKNRTAGSVYLNVGGVSVYDYGTAPFSGNSTYKRSFVATTTGSVTFSVVPSSDFNGSVDNFSVRAITGTSQPSVIFYDSFGGVFAEIRGCAAGGLTNLAIGSDSMSKSLGGGNSAFGQLAMRFNTTGTNNSAFGRSALYSNTTGYSNSAIGLNAGRYTASSGNNQTSTNSVYIGAETKAGADGNTNEIVIGYNATGSGSNTVTLGNTSITKTILRGSVLIGTTDDIARLSVVGTANTKQLVVRASSTQTQNLQEWQNSVGTTLAYITASGAASFASLMVSGTQGLTTTIDVLDADGVTKKRLTFTGGLLTAVTTI